MDKLDTAKMLIENCLGASLREITRDSLRMAIREIEEYQLSVKYLDLANVSTRIPPKPVRGDYYEGEIEGAKMSTRVKGKTWRQEYRDDLKDWLEKYGC